jgi:hypothetical protein
MPAPLLTRHTSQKTYISRDTQPRSRGALRVRAVPFVPPSSNKGAGKARRQLAPAVRVQQKARGRTTGAAGITRPSPRDGFTSYTCSPRGPAFLPPSPARSSHRRLGISTGMPGPHAFDVRTGLFVGADQPRCNPARPPHPASTSVTIAKRPSCEAGCGQRTTISEKKKVIFCCWTARQT